LEISGEFTAGNSETTSFLKVMTEKGEEEEEEELNPISGQKFSSRRKAFFLFALPL